MRGDPNVVCLTQKAPEADRPRSDKGQVDI